MNGAKKRLKVDRDKLMAFLDAGGSVADAAVKFCCHKDTVKLIRRQLRGKAKRNVIDRAAVIAFMRGGGRIMDAAVKFHCSTGTIQMIQKLARGGGKVRICTHCKVWPVAPGNRFLCRICHRETSYHPANSAMV